jgi:hypothetical protein
MVGFLYIFFYNWCSLDAIELTHVAQFLSLLALPQIVCRDCDVTVGSWFHDIHKERMDCRQITNETSIIVKDLDVPLSIQIMDIAYVFVAQSLIRSDIIFP